MASSVGLAAIAAVASLAPLTSPAAATTRSGARASAATAPIAYVANSGTTSVEAIDTATNAVIATIKVGFHPTGIVITKDGTTAYAVSAGCGTCEKPSAGHYGIYPINTVTNKPGKVIDPEATKIALDPDGYILYALNGRSDTVTIINITTGRVRKPIKVGGSPDSIAFTPKGRSAYITTTDPGTVVSISTATGKLRTSPIKIGGDPTDITLTRSGEEAYVVDGGKVIHVHTSTNSASKPIAAASYVLIAPSGGYSLALGNSSVFPITAVDGVPGQPVSVGAKPDYLAFGPTGRLAYVASAGPDTVTPIHVHVLSPFSLSAGQPIMVGSDPDAIAFTPDGSTAYVTNFADGTVTPINVKTGQAGQPITVGSHPDAVAITP